MESKFIIEGSHKTSGRPTIITHRDNSADLDLIAKKS